MTDQAQPFQGPQPTPKQALDSLLAAARTAPLPYNHHAAIDQCYQMLLAIIEPAQQAAPAKE